MEQTLYVIHILIALAIIGLVLIQHGKGAEAGAAFGAGASQTVFGSQGSGNFLTRSTAILAMLFALTCILLGRLGLSQQVPNVVDVTPVPVIETQSDKSDTSAVETEKDIPKIPD